MVERDLELRELDPEGERSSAASEPAPSLAPAPSANVLPGAVADPYKAVQRRSFDAERTGPSERPTDPSRRPSSEPRKTEDTQPEDAGSATDGAEDSSASSSSHWLFGCLCRREPLVIRHDSDFRRWWDVSQFFVLIYISFWVPFAAGFGVVVEGGLFALDLLIDCYFWVDIYMNFHTTYEDEEGETVTDLGDIAKKYRQFWLPVDLLACLPVELALRLYEGRFVCSLQANSSGSCGDSSNNSNTLFSLFKILRLARLMKLLRLARLQRIMQRYQDDFFVIMPIILMLKLCALMLFLGHLFGCFFYYVSTSDFRTSTEAELVEHELITPWIMAEFQSEHYLDAANYSVWNESTNQTELIQLRHGIGERYIASMYWAFTTMTTVGYGDISAKTVAERIFAIIGMVVGGLWFSWLIGSMSNVLAKLDSAKAAAADKMEQISQFLRETNLPKDTRYKVLAFFRKQEVKSYDPKVILSKLPFDLRSNILKHMYKDMLDKITFFRGCDEIFVTDVCSRLEPFGCTPGAFVFQRGEKGGSMFIVMRGELEVLDIDHRTRLSKLVEGDCFGVDSVFGVSKRQSTIRSLTSVSLLVIPLEDLQDLCDAYPQMESYLRHYFDAEMERNYMHVNGTKEGRASGEKEAAAGAGAGGSPERGRGTAKMQEREEKELIFQLNTTVEHLVEEIEVLREEIEEVKEQRQKDIGMLSQQVQEQQNTILALLARLDDPR